MQVYFSRKTELRLNEAARASGCAAEDYVRDLVERCLNEDTAFHEAVRKGFDSLDRGDFVEEEEMNTRVERMLRS